MNPIEWFVLANPDVNVMDLLQGQGLISDNCVVPHDIAITDQDRAIKFLQTLVTTL